MSTVQGLDEYEVSRKPGLSLEDAIVSGDVPTPELMRFQGWLAWRGKEGSRPARRKGDTAGTTGKFEAELRRSTMEKIYGEDWRAELDARELAELAASSDEGEEYEEEEELMPDASVPGAAPKAFPQAAAVQRSSSPAASRMSSSVGDEGDVVARLKARLETPFVPQLEDFESYSSRVQRIGEALSQLNSPIPEGEMEKMLFRAEVTGELEGASDPLRHLKVRFGEELADGSDSIVSQRRLSVLIQMIQEKGGKLSTRADKLFSSEEGSPEKVMPESTSPVARTLLGVPRLRCRVLRASLPAPSLWSFAAAAPLVQGTRWPTCLRSRPHC